MINQIQTIKAFTGRAFTDLPHSLVIEKDLQGNEIANGDRANAILTFGAKRYRIEAASSYVAPPLGIVTMTDLSNQHVISGNKSDDLWKQIEAHIRGTPYTAATAPKSEEVHQGATVTSLPLEPSDGRVPYLAMPAVFITNRGEGVAGMEEIAAMVTRVISPTVVSLTVFPDTGECFWRNSLQRRSPGRQHNCWDFAEPEPESPSKINDAAREAMAERRAKRA